MTQMVSAERAAALRNKCLNLMMRADTGFHADQARRHIGKAGLDLATRPFLTQHNGTTLIVAHDVEFLPISIPTTAIAAFSVWDMACSLSWRPFPALEGREHGRTIPLTELRDECCTCPPPGPHHQCAFSTASTDVTPAIIEPVIATSAGTPRGNSRLISEAMKIAAMGRAMTK